MTPIENIRRNIFKMKRQVEFAKCIGVSSSTVHRWENGAPMTSDNMQLIRDAADRLDIAWDDRWFFEIPKEHAA